MKFDPKPAPTSEASRNPQERLRPACDRFRSPQWRATPVRRVRRMRDPSYVHELDHDLPARSVNGVRNLAPTSDLPVGVDSRRQQISLPVVGRLKLGPSESVYLSPEVIPHDGPARVLLGSYGTATSAIKAPSPMNYLAVHLKAGERWSYQPPAGHTVLWTAVGMDSIVVPDELRQGELVALKPSSA